MRFHFPVLMKRTSSQFGLTVDGASASSIDGGSSAMFCVSKKFLDPFMAMISAISSLDMLRMRPSMARAWPSGSMKIPNSSPNEVSFSCSKEALFVSIRTDRRSMVHLLRRPMVDPLLCSACLISFWTHSWK